MDLTEVLRALHAAGDRPTSGEALAARLGVSRAAVWKAITQLRAEGLGIPGGRHGYRIADPAGWGPATLAWRCGRAVQHEAVCESTSTLARARARAGEAGALVVADAQTAGRGRLGRSWQAAPGEALLFSLVLRPGVPVDQVARGTLAWGAAMAGVLDLRLKWPNDLVTAEGHKVAGVLAELELRGEAFGAPPEPYVVLGVGINVLQQAFPEDLPQARSLAQLGRDPATLRDRARLLGELVAAIEAVDLRAPGLLDPWRARSMTLGRRVTVAGREGVATGLRDDGALLVDGEPVLAGDVELVT